MKRVWIAIGLLLAILVGTLVHSFYVAAFTGNLTAILEEAQRQAEADRWESALELTKSAHQTWEDHDAYLHVFLRHSETDAIHILFREVNEFIRCEKLGEYTAANAQLMTELELLAEAERLSVKNVL